ncbi:aromatic acid exporter family protein [Microbacterium sp. PRF11]|uniref:FUSC family protein n=1 Tax=Microbacterium sp. PRF11 TaxID=2962593 RepID=UPI0028813A39|nr:FUSC family protein [Microbacterium sp. PRF11]MDT0116937.1 aromatic acid exporter family protein [Microbacterium sp. PRF11]
MRVPPFLDPRRWWADAVTPDRLVLALKTAAAAALAWYLAPLVPFAQSEYSYYAPLGVLVSMYPTVARSASSGIQAVVGLALGIGLGLASLAVVGTGLPRIVAVAAVILVGVLLAGIRALGVGRDWVAIAALFVLLLGGTDPDGYSVSYLMTMAFGVVVGVVVNLVVVPPLRVKRADDRLGRLRDDLGDALHRIAEALAGRAFDPEAADAATAGLMGTLAEVREEVELADESRRYNPRGRRLRAPRDLNRRRLDALTGTADATRELSAALSRLTAGSDADTGLPDDVRRRLATAVDAVSALAATPPDPEATTEQLRAAERALTAYTDALRTRDASRGEPLDAWEAAVSLRRVIAACGPFSDPDASTSTR